VRKPIAGRIDAAEEVTDFHLSYSFRMTQTREKLAKEGIQGQERAIDTHQQVGKEVREAIRRIGGTMPENLPPAEDIKQVEKRLKGSPPPLRLDGPAAQGLTGPEPKK
jgi:DNA-damage-inducible protein D